MRYIKKYNINRIKSISIYIKAETLSLYSAMIYQPTQIVGHKTEDPKMGVGTKTCPFKIHDFVMYFM